jgi:hypothetical protein
VVLNLSSQPQRFARHQRAFRGQIVLSTYLDRSDEEMRETILLRADEGVVVILE